MKLMLIGGGEIGRGSTSYETEFIDQEIVSMSGVLHPKFLFIGLASSYADSYYDVIKKIYQKLGCETSYLKKNNLIHNPLLVEQKIKDADIIYIGGGDTIKLLDAVSLYHLEPLLREAMEKDTVLAGISAGAILLAKEGYSDSYILRGESSDYSFVSGLAFTDISITPHFHSDSKKTEQLKNDLYKSKKKVYGIENGAALKIMNDTISVISSIDNASCYLVSNQDTYQEIKL